MVEQMIELQNLARLKAMYQALNMTPEEIRAEIARLERLINLED